MLIEYWVVIEITTNIVIQIKTIGIGTTNQNNTLEPPMSLAKNGMIFSYLTLVLYYLMMFLVPQIIQLVPTILLKIWSDKEMDLMCHSISCWL